MNNIFNDQRQIKNDIILTIKDHIDNWKYKSQRPKNSLTWQVQLESNSKD